MIVIVNATALDASGALTILKQFIAKIPQDDVQYIIFVSDRITISSVQSNVKLVPICGVKSFIKRWLWDAFGVRKWLQQHNIQPSASLSMQNTNFRTGYDIPNFIYYHQPMALFPYKWSPWRRKERKFWFYKKVYPIFVKLFINHRTEIFVQLKYIKHQFTKTFDIHPERIHVVTPELNLSHSNETRSSSPIVSAKEINLFYPATPFPYKNHHIITTALSLLKTYKTEHSFQLYLTSAATELPVPTKVPIVYLGRIPFSEVQEMYDACDALVFPSYIETYGMPLLEAAYKGIPILVSDLPYAREVLSGYEGVTFIPYNDPQAWAEAISRLTKQTRFTPFQPNTKASWDTIFETIKKSISYV